MPARSHPMFSPSKHDTRCSRCYRRKLRSEMARKDARSFRSFCKNCDTFRRTGVNHAARRAINIEGLADALAANPYGNTKPIDTDQGSKTLIIAPKSSPAISAGQTCSRGNQPMPLSPPTKEGKTTCRTHVSLADDAEWQEQVKAKRVALRARQAALTEEFGMTGEYDLFKTALSAECITPPTGQAAGWYEDVYRSTFGSALFVAYQIARLCGEDSEVTLPISSLADAVQRYDDAGRLENYTDVGIRTLKDHGWLETERAGRAGTTFRLTVGEVL